MKDDKEHTEFTVNAGVHRMVTDDGVRYYMTIEIKSGSGQLFKPVGIDLPFEIEPA